MTIEAAAGKNVVMHVGKSYNIAANTIASEIVEKCPEVSDVTCVLVSRIGVPAETPQLVELQIRTRDEIPLDVVRPSKPSLWPICTILRSCHNFC